MSLPQHVRDEILQRYEAGHFIAQISAELCVPITAIRILLEDAGIDTSKRGKPLLTVVPDLPPPEEEPEPATVAPKDLRVDALLRRGDKSTRYRVRVLAKRVREEVALLKLFVEAEEAESAAKTRAEKAAKELLQARDSLRKAGLR